MSNIVKYVSKKERKIISRIRYEDTTSSFMKLIRFRVETELSSGDTFTLKELLYDFWNLLSISFKQQLGRKFSKLVKSGKCGIDVDVYRHKSNTTEYVVI